MEGLSLLIKVILVGRDKGRSRKIKDCYSCLWLLDNQQDMALGTSKSQKGLARVNLEWVQWHVSA